MRRARRRPACCGQAHHLARGDQFGGHVGQLELQGLEAGDGLAELLALLHVLLRL
jgi:hypothetical protein